MTDAPRPAEKAELVEIAHCGGTVTFEIREEADGRISSRVAIRGSRPNAMAFVAVYAISQGIAVSDCRMGGINQPFSPPPFAGCHSVFLSSDSTGLFGRQCRECSGYWRSEWGNRVCPYCGAHWPADYMLLTEAQQHYVAQYCAKIREVYADPKPGDYVIDMDAVADAVGSVSPKPPFYYAEERQQNEFKCEACGEASDVLGRYAYCSSCGTRNGVQELSVEIQKIRDRINAGGPYEGYVKDLVSAFDSLAGNHVDQLLARVPLTPERRARMTNRLFHDLRRVAADFKDVFDIDILGGFGDDEIAFGTLMFHRRHVYEHNGGEADERYIANSGDNVRVKQALHESQESTHRLANVISRLGTNLHKGFHEIFPPLDEPIKLYQTRKSKGWVT
ncbi:MAG TPA: hypothetical protein VFI79_18140 [Gemmatimonadales bacterium]|nr:hypothetical protein [Gemmatimonadales bacterium]